MVSDTKERQDVPAYALDHVKRLAASEKIVYGSVRVEHDIANLGYSDGEVCRCIANLDETCFQHAERPRSSRRWQDVYHCRWRPSSAEQPDELYLKLLVSTSTITLTLCSFHRHR